MNSKWQVRMATRQTHKPILVLGAGSWGSALALLLHRQGVPVRWWTNALEQAQQVNTLHENPVYLPGVDIPHDLVLSDDLPALLDGIEDVLIVVPSFAFYETLLRLKSIRPQGLRLAWATKGLEPNKRELLHDVVASVYGADAPMAVISGPSFAKEVAVACPTAVSIACNNDDFLADLMQRMHSAFFRMYQNTDLTGVELCGVVKNVMAIGVGICDGLGLGANTRCALITRGLAEMTRLCVAVGGQAETAMSLAGVGDLILTCTDNQSRNRRFGLALGQGKSIESAQQTIGQAIEGYANAQQLFDLAEKFEVDAPIIRCLFDILYRNAPIQEQVAILMGRDARVEY
jgi:glycerol-3-phosphate dehydrogenase (NAD(P)+)